MFVEYVGELQVPSDSSIQYLDGRMLKATMQRVDWVCGINCLHLQRKLHIALAVQVLKSILLDENSNYLHTEEKLKE